MPGGDGEAPVGKMNKQANPQNLLNMSEELGSEFHHPVEFGHSKEEFGHSRECL